MRAFKLVFNLMHLPVLGACQQGVEALAAHLADVAFSGDVRLPVLQQLGGRGETTAADGADLRELAFVRVGRLMMDGQRPQVGEGTPAELAGEGNGQPVVFTFVLCQIPGVLEGAFTLRAVERPFSGVDELVPPDI